MTIEFAKVPENKEPCLSCMIDKPDHCYICNNEHSVDLGINLNYVIQNFRYFMNKIEDLKTEANRFNELVEDFYKDKIGKAFEENARKKYRRQRCQKLK